MLYMFFGIPHWTYSDIIHSDGNIRWSYGTIEFVFKPMLEDLNARLHALLLLQASDSECISHRIKLRESWTFSWKQADLVSTHIVLCVELCW